MDRPDRVDRVPPIFDIVDPRPDEGDILPDRWYRPGGLILRNQLQHQHAALVVRIPDAEQLRILRIWDNIDPLVTMELQSNGFHNPTRNLAG